MDDVLVYAVDDPDVVREAEARVARAAPLQGGLGAVARYIERYRGRGSVTALHPHLHARQRAAARADLALSEADVALAPLASVKVLRLAHPSHRHRVERELRADNDQITYVHAPAVRYPAYAPGPPASDDPDQWGLRQCRFEETWDTLDTAPDASVKSIGIIDQGSAKGHHELRDRVTTHALLSRGRPMDSPHAGWVAGIITAIRDGTDKDRLRGCCSANLHLYNVWRSGGKFDACAYYRALLAVAEAGLPVLNVSMVGTADRTEERHIQACLARDVVVVAAMGRPNRENRPVYPADYEEVIAVGGTNPDDDPSTSSRPGPRTWLVAPADRILTIKRWAEYDTETGTSFSTAFVTAAIWLARRKKPCLRADEIRDLLKAAVDPATAPQGGPSEALGHGRLDMRQLSIALGRVRDCT